MPRPNSPFTRRRLLAGACAAWATTLALPSLAQPQKGAGSASGVCQIVDMSPNQQDVSKDFLIGSRAAWQEINSRGGLRGKRVQHIVLETDGSAASLRLALDSARDNPAALALAGSAGDPLAQGVAQMSARDGLEIAHVAPWLQTSAYDADGRTMPIFSSRLEQIAHAIRSLSVMGVTEIGAVYASSSELALYKDEVERTGAALKVKVRHFPSSGDLSALGQKMAPSTPALLLFFGGTPELVQLTQGLESQARQRYVVAMADINLQTLQQMGAARKTPIIATQVVPVVTSSLPIVRAYRESLTRFFDEPPTSLSLAGYLSAKSTYELLASIDGPLTRSKVLNASQKTTDLDLGGFRISLTAQRRTSNFVTQSMLTADGRVIG